MVHDFNNMLTVVLGNIELLREDVRQVPHALESLADIERAAGRTHELMRQLQSIARTLPGGAVAGTVTVGALHEAIKRAVTRAAPLFGDAVRIELSLAASENGAGVVRVSATDFEQAVYNLLTNARSAIGSSGTVAVSAAVVAAAGEGGSEGADNGIANAPDTFRLSVRDDGAGIDSDGLRELFSPFFTTKAAAKGAGLGLLQVNGVVQRSGGSVSVESARGSGTEVRVVLEMEPL